MTIGNLAFEGKMNWHTGPLSIYESGWIALHRFLWLNSLEVRELSKLLRRELGKGQPQSKDLVDLMKRWPVTEAVGKWVSERSLAHLVGSDASVVMLKDGLRLCPECLSVGFHSWIFQFSSLKTCPFHGCALQRECPNCERPIGATDFSHPFECSSCKSLLVSEQHAPATSIETQVQMASTFAHATRELKRLADPTVSFHGNNKWANLDFPGLSGFLSECLLRHAGVKDLPPNGALFPLRSRVARRSKRDERTGHSFLPPLTPSLAELAWPRLQTEQSRSISMVLRECVVVAKSLNRKFGQQVSRICGHRRTSMLHCIKNDSSEYGLHYEVFMAPTDCPACATLDWWRAEVSKVVALSEHLGHIEKSGRWVVDDSEATFRGRFLLNEPDFSNALLTMFTKMANSMRDVISPEKHDLRSAIWELTSRAPRVRVRSMSSVRDGVEEEELLRFPVTRYVIEPSEIWIDNAIYAYTLESAWAALAECVQLRLKGPLWGPPDARRSKWLNPVRRFWYLGVGRASLGPRIFPDDLRLKEREASHPQLELFGAPLSASAMAAKYIAQRGATPVTTTSTVSHRRAATGTVRDEG